MVWAPHDVIREGPSSVCQGACGAHLAAGMKLSPRAHILYLGIPLFHTPAHPLLGCLAPALLTFQLRFITVRTGTRKHNTLWGLLREQGETRSQGTFE